MAEEVLGLSSRLLDAGKRGEIRRSREVHQLDIGYPQSPLALESPSRRHGLRAGDRASDAPIKGAAGQPARLWLGRLFPAAILRQAGVTPGAHLAAINLGLKTIPVDRCRNRDRETRLLAIAYGLIAAAEIGMKEHDRLALARTMFERKLGGRRTSSKLPELVELPTPEGSTAS